MKGKTKKIGIFGCIVLILYACVVDLSSFLLTLVGIGVLTNIFIGIVFYIPITFWQFFTNRLNKKSGLYTLIFGIVSVIPFFSALPEALAEVVMLVLVNNSKELLTVWNKYGGLIGTAIPEIKAIQKIDQYTGGTLSTVASKATGTEVNIQGNTKGKLVMEGGELKKETSFDTLNLRDANKKNGINENTLDLQNRRQSAANTGTNLPSNRGEAPIPRQVRNATMGDENEEQLAA